MKKIIASFLFIMCSLFCFGCVSDERAEDFTSQIADIVKKEIADSDISEPVEESVPKDGTVPGTESASEDSTASGTESVPEDSTASGTESVPEDSTVSETDTISGDAAASEKEASSDKNKYVDFYFRSNKLLEQHYEKHGKDMGFKSKEDYRKAASDVVNNPKALHKTEAEDGDYVFYLEDTNEFVIVSKDGYIRTYFLPDQGRKYYDRQ